MGYTGLKKSQVDRVYYLSEQCLEMETTLRDDRSEENFQTVSVKDVAFLILEFRKDRITFRFPLKNFLQETIVGKLQHTLTYSPCHVPNKSQILHPNRLTRLGILNSLELFFMYV